MTKERQYKVLSNLLLLFSVFGLMFSVYIFGNAYHNIDLGQNMRYMESELGITLSDLTSSGRVMDGAELYRIGCWQMRLSFLLLFISTFGFAVGWVGLQD